MAIMQDLFPGYQMQNQKDEILSKMINEKLIENKFSNNEQFLLKCGEISDILKTRFGIMLVGAAMSGKTTLL